MAPNNPLPIHGNEKTMNLNHLILTNIQSSPYFKVNLYELKTYHEVIDEIYYKVSHLEPWEKNSRKTAGQTGMCGGVRGVGAGGIVSSAFCLLYKLFTLRLTRKQVMGLCNHTDSSYIRGLGFMYIRYTQNPADFWDWYEEYLEDEEEIDVKAGGGHSVKIGEMLRQWLTKLEWYSTLFPRIPVPVQKTIEQKLKQYDLEHGPPAPVAPAAPAEPEANPRDHRGGYPEQGKSRDSPANRYNDVPRDRGRRPTPPFNIAKEFEKESSSSRSRRSRSRSRDKHRHRSRSRDRDRRERRSRSKDRHRRSRSKDRRDRRRSRSRDKKEKRERRSRSRDSHRHKRKHRSRSRDRDRRETSFERDLRKEKARQKRHRDD